MSTTFAGRRSVLRRRRSEARQQILDAARRELETTSFRDLRVDDLMKATGLSRTAFYRYFPDREAVLVELLEEVWAALGDARDEGPGTDPLSADHVDRLAAVLAGHRGVLKAVADAATGDEYLERSYRAFMYDFWIGELVARIPAAQSRGLGGGLDPELAGEALGWMAERMVTQTLDRDPRMVLDTIIAIVVRCLSTGGPPLRPPAPAAAVLSDAASTATDGPVEVPGGPNHR
jgi:AcrR family transcriptional regulator